MVKMTRAAGIAAVALLVAQSGSAEVAAPVLPQSQDLSGLTVGMIYPPLPAPLEWRGGACFGTPGEDSCAKGYSLVIGTDGAYTALLTGVSAGHTADGSALWTLVDLVALPFATTEQTYYLGGECAGAPEGSTPVLFFDRWSADGVQPKPIWGATIDLASAKITGIEDFSRYDCVFEEP